MLRVNAASTAASPDGLTWATAFPRLEQALAKVDTLVPAPTTADPAEIWIVRGTYKPTTGGDRTAAFVLKSHTHLLGGFKGTETDSSQPHSPFDETILSGDIGIPMATPFPALGTTDPGTLDNCFNVVRATDATDVILQEISIVGGAAIGHGLPERDVLAMLEPPATAPPPRGGSWRLSLSDAGSIDVPSNRSGIDVLKNYLQGKYGVPVNVTVDEQFADFTRAPTGGSWQLIVDNGSPLTFAYNEDPVNIGNVVSALVHRTVTVIRDVGTFAVKDGSSAGTALAYRFVFNGFAPDPSTPTVVATGLAPDCLGRVTVTQGNGTSVAHEWLVEFGSSAIAKWHVQFGADRPARFVTSQRDPVTLNAAQLFPASTMTKVIDNSDPIRDDATGALLQAAAPEQWHFTATRVPGEISRVASNPVAMGGGIYARASQITAFNVRFRGNLATYGGGAYSEGSYTDTGAFAAGKFSLVGCTMEHNRAERNGGAILDNSSLVTVVNSALNSNEAGEKGGGIHTTVIPGNFRLSEAAQPSDEDRAAALAAKLAKAAYDYELKKLQKVAVGGVPSNNADTAITGATVLFNTISILAGDSDTGRFFATAAKVTRDWLTAEGLATQLATVLDDNFFHSQAQLDAITTRQSHLMMLSRALPMVAIESEFNDNVAAMAGGAISADASNIEVENCFFRRNRSNVMGGAVYSANYVVPKLLSCVFLNNQATMAYGAVANTQDSWGQIMNCTFSGNSVVQNTPSAFALGATNGSDVRVANSIFWNNTSPAFPTGGADLYGTLPTDVNSTLLNNAGYNSFALLGNIDLHNSIVQGLGSLPAAQDTIIPGGPPWESLEYLKLTGGAVQMGYGVHVRDHNSSADPRLVDGFKPGIGSPAIDAGDSTELDQGWVHSYFNTDILINPRLLGAAIDLGAVEGPGVPSSIVFVDPTATAAGTGTSWINATSLANALKLARNNPTVVREIWVKSGTYYPAASDPNAYLTVSTSRLLTVRGGFSGTETDLSQRLATNAPTILSGDLGAPGTRTDNSQTLLSIDGTGQVNIDSITFSDAESTSTSAVVSTSFNPTFQNCRFINNHGRIGAAVYVRGGTFTDCEFSNNVSTSEGGGLCTSTTTTLVRCRFLNNTAAMGGGGASVRGDDAFIENCLFAHNTSTGAGYAGGGLILSTNFSTINSSTIVDNHANQGNPALSGGGSGVSVGLSTAFLTGVVLWGNIGDNPSSTLSLQQTQIDGSASLRYSCVQGAAYDPEHVTSVDPEFVDAAGGDYRLRDYSPLVNGGDPNASITATDLLGQPRVAFGHADVGAYELQTAARTLSATIASAVSASGFDTIYRYTVSSANYNLAGATVAWQVDRGDGRGFVALANDSIVSGASTTQLTLTAPPASYSGYRFRARITGSDARLTSAEFTLNVHPAVLYVSAVPAYTGNPPDPKTQFGNIESALAVAQFPTTILVAQGTYTPPNSSGFMLQPGVALIGGYNNTFTARDPVAYPTIISGDNGGSTRAFNRDYLLYIYTNGTDFPAGNPTVVDGFTLTRARSAAVWASSGSVLTLQSCRVLDNGQGLVANGATVTLDNTTFLDNGIAYTAAIDAYASTITSHNLLIARSVGGAMRLDQTAFTLVHGTIVANHNDSTTTQGGSAGIAQNGGSLVIQNSVVFNNDAFDYQPDQGGFLQIVPSRNFAAQLKLSSGATLDLRNSTVQGLAGPYTNGNQAFEPFLDANYAPTALSPLINRGSATYTGTLTVDLAGAARASGAAPDMGAFEFTGTPATTVELFTLPTDARARVGLAAAFSTTGAAGFGADVSWQIDRGDGSGYVALATDSLHTLTSTSTSATIAVPAATLAMNGWHYRFRLTSSGYVSPPVTLTTFTPIPLYVDASKPPGLPGLTWAMAFSHPADALAVATSDNEIWVRAGTYAPKTVGGASYLRLIPHLAIYGGFAGGETSASARNGTANRTVLNGISFVNSNSYGSLGSDAVIDGFVFTGTPTEGVAIRNWDSSPTIRSCRFEASSAGAISMTNSSSLISDCVFTQRGGNAVWLSASPVQIQNCSFTGNLDTAILGDGAVAIDGSIFDGNSSVLGGALRVSGGAFTVRKTIFRGNTASNNGGAIRVESGTLRLEQSLLTANRAANDGGAIFASAPVQLVNCTVADNVAGRYGAGLTGGTSITNSIVWGNRRDPNSDSRNIPGLPLIFPDSGEQVQLYPSGTPATVHNSLVQELGATYADASNLAYDPLFTNAPAGDYTLSPVSPALNRGDNSALSAATDLIGAPRVAETTIDLGPYERTSSGGAPLLFVSLPRAAATRVGIATEFTFNYGGSTRAVQWQVDRGDGNGFVNLSDDALHTITNTGGVARVAIAQPPLAMNGWRYRVVDGPSGLTFPAVTLTVIAPIILYVDGTRVASGDGLTWATAFKSLDDALAFANNQNEIWIKRGDYVSTTVPRSVKPDVSVYGGFAGTETDRSQANPTANVTRLINSGGPTLIADGRNQAITSATIISGLVLRWTPSPGQYEAVSLYDASPTFRSCIVEDSGGVGASLSGSSSPVFQDCTFRRGADTAVIVWGGGSPVFRHVTFQDNTSPTFAGALNLSYGQAVVEDCVFQGNTGRYGGAVYLHFATGTFTRVSFKSNRATESGGGAMFVNDGTVSVRDTLFVSNQAADNGGAIYTGSGSLTVAHSTFYDNSTTGSGAAIAAYGTLSLANSIVWANRAAPGTSPGDAQIRDLFRVTVRASDIQDLTDATLLAAGSRSVDPLFVDPAAGNFTLQLRSPVIDVGAADVPLSGETDFAGNPRVTGGAPDLGAYERLTAGASPLLLTATPANVPVRDGHSAILNAAASSTLATDIVWQIDTGSGFTALTPDSTHRIVNEGRLSTLIVDPASVAMNGWRYRIQIPTESFTSAPATLTVTAPIVLRVKSGATGAANGATWTDAFPTLDGALAVATDAHEVWVAAGTYVPVFTTADFGFRLKNGVEIDGGFAGTETARNQRNPQANRTILSAEVGNPASTTDNRYVIIAFNNALGDPAITRATTIDGFVFQGAVEAAVRVRNASPTIRNCRFENSPRFAITSIDGSPLIVNCVFTGGASTALYAENSGATVVGCLFANNTASDAPGIKAIGGSAFLVSNSTFTRNIGAGVVGAITVRDSSITIRNTILWGNTASAVSPGVIENAQLLRAGTGTIDIANSIVEGLNGFAAATNLGVDPLFTNAAGGDFTLASASPAINAGAQPALIYATADLAGGVRVQGSAVDLGAYEFSGTPGTPAYVSRLVSPGPIRTGSIAEFRLEAPATPPQTITWQIDTGSGFGALPSDSRFIVTTSGGTSILRVDVRDASLTGARFRAGVAGTTYFSAPATLVVQAPTIIYVNAAATDTPDGTTWARAFRELSSALAVATTQNEIWVASGDYTPTSGSFALRDAFVVRGGFAGTETTAAQRSSSTPATVLRGRSGLPAVMFAPFLSDTPGRSTLLEGCTLASDATDVVSIFASSPTLRGCRFDSNNGIALDVHGGSPLVDSCVFNANRTVALAIDGSATPLITRSTFTANASVTGTGAITVSGAASATIEDSLFDGNQGFNGGALALGSGGGATVRRSIFRNNVARSNGGAIFVSASATLSLENVLLDDNTAYGGGGAIALVGTSAANLATANLTFTTIANNHAGQPTAAAINGPSLIAGVSYNWATLTLSHTLIWDNSRYDTTGAAVIDTATQLGGANTTPSISYSSLPGIAATSNNVPDRPLFRDPVAGDFTIDPHSPTVNRGSTAAATGISFDLTGTAARVLGAAPDLGAYETARTTEPDVVFTALPRSVTVATGTSVAFSATITSHAASALVWQVDTGSGFADFVAGSGQSVAVTGNTSQLNLGAVTSTMNNARYRVRLSGTAFASAPATLHVVNATILFVRADATGGGNGLTWAAAFNSVDAALTAATSLNEIWVAAGTYSSASSARLKSGVAVYGGFAGTETQREQRDPATSVSNLRATGSDVFFMNFSSDAAIDSTAIVDGFTLTSAGGSLVRFDYGATPIFRHCRFTGTATYAVDVAGASTSLRFEDCVFTAMNSGVRVHNAGAAAFVRCSFTDNTGPALYAFGSGSEALDVQDSEFLRNTGTSGSAISVTSGVTFSLARSRVDSNAGPAVSVTVNGAKVTTITDTLFTSNAAAADATMPGALYLDGALALSGNRFYQNTATNTSALSATVYLTNGSGTVDRCEFRGNTSSEATLALNASSAVITNSLFAANLGDKAGAIRASGGVTLVNCTIVDNRATTGYGGVVCLTGTATLRNSLLWGNRGGAFSATIEQLNLQAFASTSLANDGLEGRSAYAITSAVDTRPLFLAPLDATAAPSTNGDYRLHASSPAVDAGNNSFTTTTLDLAGNARRFASSAIDLGAYELARTAITPATIISAYPAAVTYRDGVTDTFTINVTGSGLTFAWEVDRGAGFVPVANGADPSGATYSGATTAALKISGGTFAMNGYRFRVTLGNAEGPFHTSPAATLTVPIGRLFVKSDATGTGAGDSWTNAFTTLRAALASSRVAISASYPVEIWVAAGMYYPSTTNNRNDVLTLRTGLSLYGGFAGNETSRDQRDWTTRPTIISGNIGNAASRSDNSISLVATDGITSVDANAVLDGFVLEDADDSSGNAAALRIYRGGSPTIRNTLFRSNRGDSGAAVQITGDPSDPSYTTSPRFENCTFLGNQANFGGAVYGQGATAQFVNCVFNGNRATNSGGALCFSLYSGSPGNYVLVNCTLHANAALYGGAVYTSSAHVTLRNSIVWNNTATGAGGRVLYSLSSPSDLSLANVRLSESETGTNVTVGDPLFVNAAGVDGILGTADDDLRLANSYPTRFSPAIDAGDNSFLGGTTAFDVRDNSASFPRITNGNGIGSAVVDLGAYEAAAFVAPATIAVTRATSGGAEVLGDLATALAAVADGGTVTFDPSITTITLTQPLTITRNVTVRAPTGSRVALIASGNTRLVEVQGGNAAFVGLDFRDGATPGGDGAAVRISGTAQARFYNARFLGNDAQRGGAVFAGGAAAEFVNTLFSGNTATQDGGAVFIAAGNVYFRHVSAGSNTAVANGGAVRVDTAANFVLANSILWANSAASGADLSAHAQGTLALTDSILSGTWSGARLLASDPLWANRLGADGVAGTGDDDFTLTPGSPAIDRGSNALTPPDAADLDTNGNTSEITPVDLRGAGFPRIVDGLRTGAAVVDLGAYEAAQNGAPTLPVLGPYTIAELATLTFTATATDADTPAAGLTFSLGTGAPTGASITSAGVFTWTPTEEQGPNSYTFPIVVSDGGVGGAFSQRLVTINVTEVNVAPTLAAIAPISIAEGSVAAVQLSAADADLPAQTLTFSLTSAPAFATVGTDGVLRLAPLEADGPATYTFNVIVSDGIATAQRGVSVTVTEINFAPVLAAVPPITVAEGTPMRVPLSATDANLPAQTLTYSLSNSPTGAMIDATSGVITWTPTEAQGPGTYTFTATATDNGTPALSGSTAVSVTVTEVNRPPVLAAIGSRSVAEGATLTFTATATDPDLPANTLTFSLIGAPSGASITTAGVFTWTPTGTQGGAAYTFTVRVTDDGSPALFAEEAITVAVSETNTAPTLAAVAPVSVDEGSLLTITLSASDADVPANALTFSLNNAPAGMTVSPAGVITWTPTEAQGPAVYTFGAIVTDNGTPALSATRSITVTVNEVNTAPTLPAVNTITINESAPWTLSMTASDTDLPANLITYTLINAPAGMTISNSGLISYTPDDDQGGLSYTFTVRATDNGTPALYAERTITLNIVDTNSPPTLDAIAAQTKPEGTLITFTAHATDPDRPVQTITYSLSGAPTGATIDPNTGVFTWTPTEAQGPGVFTFSVVATDNGTPVLSDSRSVTLTVTETNSAPVIADMTGLTATENVLFTTTFTATDPDVPAQTLTFSLSNAPAGAAITPAGVFTYTPSETQGGTTVTFTVNATDNFSTPATGSKTFVLTILDTNTPPVANNDTLSVTRGSSASVNVLTNDTDADVPVDTLTVTAVTQGANGTVTFTAAGSVTYTHDNGPTTSDSFTYTVSDGHGGTATGTVAVTVTASASLITVTSTADSGAGSLRDAIATLVPGVPATIDFLPALANQTITVTTVGDTANGASAFVIPANVTVTIDATAATNLIIMRGGTNLMRFFRVATGGTLTLKRVRLDSGSVVGPAGGDGVSGGGGGAGLGGAILVEGTATLQNISIWNSIAKGGPGGNYNGSLSTAGAGGGAAGGAGGVAFNANGAAGGGLSGGGGGAAGAGIGDPGVAGIAGGQGGGYPNAGYCGGGAGGFGGGGGGGLVCGGGGGAGLGGGLAVVRGTCTAIDCTFASNGTAGGAGGVGDSSHNGSAGGTRGGAIFAYNATLTLTRPVFGGNAANGGANDAVIVGDAAVATTVLESLGNSRVDFVRNAGGTLNTRANAGTRTNWTNTPTITAIPTQSASGYVTVTAFFNGFTTLTASVSSGDPSILASSLLSISGSALTLRTVGIVPPPNTSGTARVRVTGTDGASTFTEEFLVNISTGAYGVPTALNQTRSATNAGTSQIPLSASHPQNLPLTYSLVTPPAQGSISIVGSTAFYTPNAGHGTSDSFRFRVTDQFGGSSDVTTQGFTSIIFRDPPVVGPDLVLVPTGATAKVLKSTLLANDIDPGGSAITFYTIGGTSAQGATITTDANYVYYSPPSTVTGDDAVTYTVNNGFGLFGSGTITFRQQAPTSSVTRTTLDITPRSGGGVTLRLLGVPGRSYTVSVSTDLINWTALATVTADAQGLYSVDDPNSPADGSGRFYRALRNN